MDNHHGMQYRHNGRTNHEHPWKKETKNSREIKEQPKTRRVDIMANPNGEERRLRKIMEREERQKKREECANKGAVERA